jgi:polyisoprenoid-binding protein YceI
VEVVSNYVKLIDQKWCLLSGNLSIRGVTRPTQFHAAYTAASRDPLTNGWEIGLSATATVNRSDYGIRENALLTGNITSTEITIEATQAQ